MFGQLDLSCRNYVRLARDVAYTYKLYTVPAFRGHRICPAYYSFLKRELREMGFRSVMAWVEAGNQASIHAHERSGLRRAGTIWHWRVAGRAYFVTPKAIAPEASRLESRDGRLKAGSTSVS
jgi:RimJ/RimL family protein N-acetyltransferase